LAAGLAAQKPHIELEEEEKTDFTSPRSSAKTTSNTFSPRNGDTPNRFEQENEDGATEVIIRKKTKTSKKKKKKIVKQSATTDNE